MNRRTLTAAFVLASLVPAARTSAFAPQKIEAKDGVRIVHNALPGRWGATPKIRLEPIRVIGDADTDDENLAFNMPNDLVEDGRGNLYIADGSNGQIQKLAQDGVFLASLGRKGQGPGEYASIRALVIDAQDRLRVYDPSQHRLTVLETDGRVVRTVLLKKSPISAFRLLPDGLLLTDVPPFANPAPVSPTSLMRLMDEAESVRAEIGVPEDYGEPVTNQVGNSIDFAVSGDGSPVASFKYQNRIEKFSTAGRLLWRADRPLGFDTKVIEMGKFEMSGRSSTYRGPQMNRCSNGVAVDRLGRVWVVTCQRQIKPEEVIRISMSGTQSGATRKIEGNTDLRTTDMYRLDVFDPDGVLLGSLPVNQFVDGIWIYGDRLYLLDRDRGVAYHQYRIVER